MEKLKELTYVIDVKTNLTWANRWALFRMGFYRGLGFMAGIVFFMGVVGWIAGAPFDWSTF